MTSRYWFIIREDVTRFMLAFLQPWTILEYSEYGIIPILNCGPKSETSLTKSYLLHKRKSFAWVIRFPF